jgi:hypothetical protein
LFGGNPESVKQERGVREAWWREADIYFVFVSRYKGREGYYKGVGTGTW